ncbi:MAG: protein translocase subunit SecD [Acidimicrobiales bacterium]
MRRGLLASVVLVCLICFGSLGGVIAAGWSPKLGLDLEGGLSVVFQPVHKATAQQLQTVVGIMQARANGLGLASPNIGSQGGNIVVQLPGVKNFAKVISEIGSTSQLFFRPVLCAADAYTPSTPATTTTTTVPKSKSTTTTSSSTTTTTTAKSTTTTTTTPAKKKKKAATAAYVAPPPCGSAYRYTTATYITASGSSGAYNPGPGPDPALTSVPSTPASQDTAPRTVLIAAENTAATGGVPRYELGPTPYDGSTPATGEILASASTEYEATSGEGWVVNFTIKSQYSAFFDSIAKANYHLPLAIDLGGRVQSAPTINATSFGGSGQITGDFTQAQATSLALVLKYGQIPIALSTQTYTTVSPTLGKKSLQAGLLAGLLGLLLVMGYTIFYYRALGIVVVLGLVSTGALIYSIISLLGATSAGLTLDLSGMTGLIVSVGITVDSYIVYFERLKDEVRAGRSVRSSVDRGFKSAYRTILSADAVSFLGALVLWILSIGAVRGFAFMLGLSTIVDVITAYTFTRPLVILLGRNRIFTDARIFGVARGLAVSSEVGA